MYKPESVDLTRVGVSTTIVGAALFGGSICEGMFTGVVINNELDRNAANIGPYVISQVNDIRKELPVLGIPEDKIDQVNESLRIVESRRREIERKKLTYSRQLWDDVNNQSFLGLKRGDVRGGAFATGAIAIAVGTILSLGSALKKEIFASKTRLT